MLQSQGALTHLRDIKHIDDPNIQAVQMFAFNPKCVGMGELYGEYHPQTNEWQDGLASTLMRAAVADTSQAHKWLVFDGPVDPTWIENLNTVRCGITFYYFLRKTSILSEVGLVIKTRLII